MIGQLDLYGIFLPSFAALALFAYGAFRVLASLLGKVGFYRAVWHRSLFNFALYIALVGGVSAIINWLQI
ncbi:hypothetical protein EN41_04405 [Agrobacterium tumefaciens]|uniref:DUF1656 domain-containing protein n=2 Tax=Agrobacterium fabrum TaxID=1176649 RepID=Q8UJD7_AGRFC|nr:MULTISPECIES: DUF1656 domain-containing protein [Agrobacterium]KEY51924.1 hypothetical protein EN41_04405 [Agrobacterium tumefaciens]AAL46226.1 hypothetical protein Atu5540 [Agrobacterium fabrum str. C58]AYM60871.1 hypothetical protein At1D132_48640 [Agrobacterium fabrum]AYM65983.1 hypothetical protein At12D13_48310 [Agrobacterium fabrum]KJX89957.1 hypothetical protein SY94_5586 [Agrobacterium tumefaciens]